MADLTDFDQDVSAFMDDFGGTATLVISSEGAVDLDTGIYTPITEEYQVRAILLDLPLKSNGLKTITGTLIQAGDKQCFIQPLNKSSALAMPQINPNSDRVIMAGVNYKIISFKDMNPSGSNSVLIELYLRQ